MGCARSTGCRSRSSRRRTTSSASPGSRSRLLEWYDAHPGAIVPEFRANEALGLIRSGLRDFSASRTSLTWGIPLPWDPAHVAYVWFDALTNYLSAVGFGTDAERFEQWWPVNYHLIGKDIIRHHCVYWPAMLMSAGIEPPRGWAVGGWLLSGGEKMSKTTGNVVKPLDLVDTVGVDGFRYYILADTPYGQDGDFTYEGLIARYNADLANNLGNLAARVATVVGSKCGGEGPAPSADSPLAQAAAARRRRHGGGVGRGRAEPGAGGDVAARTGDQRPPRGERAVEARARAAAGGGARGRPRGACGSWRSWRRRRSPPPPRRSGSASGCPARSSTSASPPTSRGAGIPAGCG